MGAYCGWLSSREAAFHIYGALREQVELELAYVAFHGEKARKSIVPTVQPRHLTCHENGWYLRTDDLRSGQERTFLLSRMTSVAPTGNRFVPVRKLDLKKIKKDFSIFSTAEEETVRLHCSATIRQLIVERHWHESQEITELPDGGVELKLKVGISPELVRFICSWQGHAKVIEPAHLRDQTREAGRRLAESTPPFYALRRLRFDLRGRDVPPCTAGVPTCCIAGFQSALWPKARHALSPLGLRPS